MPNLNKVKKEQINENNDEVKKLKSFIKKKKSQNKALGKLLNNLNSEHIKKTMK